MNKLPNKVLDISNQTFGYFTVLSYVGVDSKHKALWLCRCKCGIEKVMLASAIKSGKTKSCGCSYKARPAFTTHGLTVGGQRTKAYRLFRKYKLTVDQFNILLQKQNYTCPVGNESIYFETAYVDHDHACCPGNITCGKCIRGLLCSGCNTMLGHAKDNIEIMRAGANYLESFASR